MTWFEDSDAYLAFYDQEIEFTHDIDRGWLGVAYQSGGYGTYNVTEYLRIKKAW
jgi:hypothetical protein